MDNLFAYGTLMCEDIMQDVAGCLPHNIPATLTGYSRRSVRNEYYPAVIREKDSFVEGTVYLDVPDRAWESLDTYEGDMYARTYVHVRLADGSEVPAVVYVATHEFLRQIEEYDWDFAGFMTSREKKDEQ